MRRIHSVGRVSSGYDPLQRNNTYGGAAGRSVAYQGPPESYGSAIITATGMIEGPSPGPSPVHAGSPARLAREANRQAGFTLVEVLVVLSIIGLVVGLIGPRVVGYLNDAKLATARIQATTLSNAIELFFIDNGRYPLESEGLQALVAPPANLQTWNGPYLKAAAVPRDPWGKPYHYAVQSDGRRFLISFVGDQRGKGEDGEINKRYSATRGNPPP